MTKSDQVEHLEREFKKLFNKQKLQELDKKDRYILHSLITQWMLHDLLK